VPVEGLYRAWHISRRCIHQHIDSPQLGRDARDNGLDRRGVSQIGRQCEGGTA
jgi:hypothetical protein